MKYNPTIVCAFFKSNGLPKPLLEFQFAKFALGRKWRFDFAWVNDMCKIYLEVNGGIWTGGRHSRGASMKKDWEKQNAATILGWRGLWFEPKDLCLVSTVEIIRAALEAPNPKTPKPNALVYPPSR